jgi:hypothetical protein
MEFNDHLMSLSEQEALDSFVSQKTATGTVRLNRQRAVGQETRYPKRKIDSQVSRDVEGTWLNHDCYRQMQGTE